MCIIFHIFMNRHLITLICFKMNELKKRFPVCRLTVQYRFHGAIREFPSARFYESKLQDGAGTSDPTGSMFATAPPQVSYLSLPLIVF
jgi:hypothetical protein